MNLEKNVVYFLSYQTHPIHTCNTFVLSSFHCSYVIPSLAASVVINIPKYFESTLHYYPVGEVPTLLDNGTTVNVTQYQVRTMVARWL